MIDRSQHAVWVFSALEKRLLGEEQGEEREKRDWCYLYLYLNS